jgi:hypothetical protein
VVGGGRGQTFTHQFKPVPEAVDEDGVPPVQLGRSLSPDSLRDTLRRFYKRDGEMGGVMGQQQVSSGV